MKIKIKKKIIKLIIFLKKRNIIKIIIELYLFVVLIKISIARSYNVNYQNTIHFENKSLSDNIINKINNLSPFKEDKNNIINKKQIHISMSLDNNLVYPTLVSMTSALENNNKNQNVLVYYLLLENNFNITNIEIFESLKIKYQVKINYYIIPKIFNNLRRWTLNTECIYYKLILPYLFKNLKRIIYLDGDTLIYKDISEMYELDFNENYVLGYPFSSPEVLDKFGIYSINYINGGVLLFNLEKIRKENKTNDLLECTIQHNEKLEYLEQDSINLVLYPKTGFLPLKYGVYLMRNLTIFNKYIKYKLRFRINKIELKKAFNNPSILHFSGCYPKIWNKKSISEFFIDDYCKIIQKDFYYYANKTNYYLIMYNLYLM